MRGKTMAKQLMWAFGSNLNVAQMRRRCPNAVKVCKLAVPNARLVFRGVADVEFVQGGKCPGGLWYITAADERALDEYEGVANGLYDKCYMTLRIKDRTERCLYYLMNEDGIMPPSEHYLASIVQGYKDFGLPLASLNRAVERSW